MIVAPLPPPIDDTAPETSIDRLLFIQQADHAHLAADFLALVNIEGLPEHPWREDLLFACREHDNGWAEFDSAPSVKPDGTAHDFLSVSAARRLEIWHLGIERYRQSRPAAALLITQHALRLHRRRQGEPRWDDALERWREIRDGLLAESSLEKAEMLELDAWLDLADSVSLAACARSSKPSRCGRFTLTPDPDDQPQGPATVGIHPFPLAGSTLFRVNARRLPRRAFRSDSDLAMQLAGERWQRLQVRLRPGPPGRIR